MSTFLKRRSEHGSSRELQCSGVDGKPTRLSTRNTAIATSFAAEWLAQLAPFGRDASLFPFPPRRACLVPLCDYSAWTESTLLTLPSGTANTVPGRPAIKRLSLHELPSAANSKPLTKANSVGYAGILKDRSRCDESAGKTSGSVPGALDNQGKEARS